MRVTLVTIGLSVGLMIAGGAAPALAASAPAANDVHCVQQVPPPDQPAAAPHCFSTYAAVVGYLTGGRVELAAEVGAPEPNGSGLTALDASIADAEQALNVHVLSTEYVNANFTGATYTFTWSSGCSSVNVAWSSMPSGWNNIISSSRPGTNCDAIHYDNTGATPNVPPSGDSYACPSACSSLGTMNDRTSSMRWVHT